MSAEEIGFEGMIFLLWNKNILSQPGIDHLLFICSVWYGVIDIENDYDIL